MAESIVYAGVNKKDKDHAWAHTPNVLVDLECEDLPYVCLTMAFYGVKSDPGGPIVFPHLNGNILIYNSHLTLAYVNGQSSFIERNRQGLLNGEHIQCAWNFLLDNNHLYNHLPRAPSLE